MKKLLAAAFLILALSTLKAQSFKSGENTKCEVQVAFAISEGDGFGEYSITRLVPLQPGDVHSFRNEGFASRQIYSKVEWDEMFIVRFEPTGITHFLDATVPNGYETYLNGGCALTQKPFFNRDGEFIIDASSN
ncbi:hypothetical protein N9A49_01680 [Salibacteraceae bacterium]|nr:hypothetical protein [Salibacteraceae bacterium]MDB0002143.1 hypothetical protein [Salibacteraceae bacterium]MDB4105249.1 hypothetical protein [Salibacteraceae bacterium]MDB9709975.1 hypothetical protein [Salibacteraceae bacterium]MDC1304802.1 hypothetical protein [Salibacteraceae bacterium]